MSLKLRILTTGNCSLSDASAACLSPSNSRKGHRPLIPDFLLKHKREGRFITAVPALGWDQQAGLNLGVVGFLFDNDKKDDPFFRSTPYRSP